MAKLLKIATTITEKKSVEREISLPYYFKNAYGNPCKIVSNEHFICVIASATNAFVAVNQVEYNKKEIAEGTPCTADEFEAAYSQAMLCIETINRNEEPSREHDENEEIDLIRERRAS